MMEVFDFEQNTEEWLRARMGIPTASEFSSILAKGQGKTRATYMRKLAGEIITGEPMENFNSFHMERGKIMEEEARSFYAFMRSVELQQVGFIRNGEKGCSPDCLIGDDGMLEIKTQKPDLIIDTILKDQFPPEHKAQCQGALWVAEREWIDIIVYWPKFPPFIKRATRDEEYIANLSDEVGRFNVELHELVEKIKSYEAAA